MNRNIFGFILLFAGILIGVIATSIFDDEDEMEMDSTMGSETSAEKKILYWVAPMDSNFRRDKPGKSPMGMDLIPVYENDGQDSGEDTGIVKIKPEVINNLGVRTEKVERGNLWRKINTVGYVDFDESKISHIHLRTEGWIHNLAVDAEGERVGKDELLFTLYSPILVNAQEEYVQVLAGNNRNLIKASRERLYALGMTERQIDKLEKSHNVEQHVATYAPQTGIVYNLNVRHGMYVRPEHEVMALAELDTVWLQAEVFERQASWVKIGQVAEARLPSLPGEVWEGEVEYIYPDLDPRTRTLRVRLRFDNPEEKLKPNMYAHVAIYGGAKRNVLSIPSQALIREGEKQRVITALGEGRFRPQEVVAGIESGDWIEIVSGLEEGDEIVISSQFLLDSESSLKASMKRMEPMEPMEQTEPMNEQEMADPVEIMGMGVIRSVKPAENRVNITHDPIDALGWPTMTMDFQVSGEVDLSTVQADDHIHFMLRKDPDNSYVITSIRAMDMESN